MKRPYPCLWFQADAEKAAAFYASLVPGSKVLRVARYGPAAARMSGQPEGSVMTVHLSLGGLRVLLLQGGPAFRLTEAASLVVECADQREIDRIWGALSRGGVEMPCGWVKDRFGVSWQVVPAALMRWMADPAVADRIMAAFAPMKKLDLATLRDAYRAAKAETRGRRVSARQGQRPASRRPARRTRGSRA
jgi:predicted 3-demethylubiquinone-9 3-methyltransferase (glyoxalase superfamily)